jgi:hypothetical protein
VDKMRGEWGQKMSVFIDAQGEKLSTQGGWVNKWQNSVYVVVECPLSSKFLPETLLNIMIGASKKGRKLSICH